MADLFASGVTESNAVTYMKETTFTNAAAPVAEAGTKPESTLIFDAVSDPVQKIAHWLPVTEGSRTCRRCARIWMCGCASACSSPRTISC
jgi:HK97 family phage major capsid protein